MALTYKQEVEQLRKDVEKFKNELFKEIEKSTLLSLIVKWWWLKKYSKIFESEMERLKK